MTYAAEGMGSLTQTGQRSGGLTINSDQQRSGRAFALGLRKWWIPPPLKAPNNCLRETSHALCCCFFKRFSKKSTHHIRQEDWQYVRWIIPALDSLLAGINSRCEPGDASRKHSEGAFSGGGIHHLRRPDAKPS